MDATAISLARENTIPIMVFNLCDRGNFKRVLQDEGEYTLVTNQESEEL
jgi:uridylate kinase